ncbi:IS66 family insertion sequence element accessory protein TnpB [Thiolapillus sp.]|uniref:IS66 family insertion sequence element accessory protein TnpB n=1 Tax=Thiolapillus sp. TaxID=2017437 RepID=UPI003AF5F76C
MGHNPFEGVLYAFTNRRRDKIKLLYWEDNGFVLYYKSLAEEKFHWPGGEEELVSLTGQQTLPAMESEAKAGSPQ